MVGILYGLLDKILYTRYSIRLYEANKAAEK